MNKFTQHFGIPVPLDAANVDTDAIIPKQFLQKSLAQDLSIAYFMIGDFLPR